MANREALEGELNRIFGTRTTDAWLAILEEGGFPAGPVLYIAEMPTDPQALVRELIVTTNHPVAGRVETPGQPVKFSAPPGGIAQPAPIPDEHRRAVLVDPGLSAAESARKLARANLR